MIYDYDQEQKKQGIYTNLMYSKLARIHDVKFINELALAATFHTMFLLLSHIRFVDVTGGELNRRQ